MPVHEVGADAHRDLDRHVVVLLAHRQEHLLAAFALVRSYEEVIRDAERHEARHLPLRHVVELPHREGNVPLRLSRAPAGELAQEPLEMIH